MDDIRYDPNGRMIYHPKIHFSHGIAMTEYEVAYLCKFWEFDGRKLVSMSLGKTEPALGKKYNEVRSDGRLGYYRNLWDSYLEEE